MPQSVSRRAFLGAAGAASLSVVPGARSPYGSTPTFPDTEVLDVDVAIVGPTLTGLVAAEALRGRGVQVAVVGTGHEGGGTEGWLVDEHVRSLWLARRVRATMRHLPSTAAVIEADGDGVRPVPEGAWSGDSRAASEIESALVKLDRMAREIDPDAPWTAVNASVRDARTLGAWLDASIVGRAARRRLEQGFELALGASPSEVSLLFALLIVSNAGGAEGLWRAAYYPQRWMPMGLKGFVTPLADSLTDVVRRGHVQGVDAKAGLVILDASTFTVRARELVLAGAPVPGAPVTSRFVPGTLALAICTYGPDVGVPPMFDTRVLGDGAPLHVVHTVDGGRMLVGVIAGRAALEWTRLDAGRRRDAVLRSLGDWLGSQAAKPSGYAEVTEPSLARVVGLPGAVTTHGPALRQPRASVWPAGPESAMAWLGHGEGLIRTGRRVAGAVAERLGV